MFSVKSALPLSTGSRPVAKWAPLFGLAVVVPLVIGLFGPTVEAVMVALVRFASLLILTVLGVVSLRGLGLTLMSWVS